MTIFFCASESWFVTLRERTQTEEFENGALTIFGPERGEVTEGWRKILD
jgi:hypothetical protein